MTTPNMNTTEWHINTATNWMDRAVALGMKEEAAIISTEIETLKSMSQNEFDLRSPGATDVVVSAAVRVISKDTQARIDAAFIL